MSTNSNCFFIEIAPGRWYYVLEHTNAPKNSWDWREYADAYGPFPTHEVAIDHLHKNHANPGGHYDQLYDPNYKPDAVMQQLLAKAPENTRPPSYGFFYGGRGNW